MYQNYTTKINQANSFIHSLEGYRKENEYDWASESASKRIRIKVTDYGEVGTCYSMINRLGRESHTFNILEAIINLAFELSY
jgi:hypothetical protein